MPAHAVTPAPWAERLRAAGLRSTRPRLAVLEVLDAAPHITAERVAETVRSEIGAVSTQAVYDTLNTLTGRGLLRRFEPAGSSMRYETVTDDNHHHLVCRRCGAVSDVPCATRLAPCLAPPTSSDFVVDEAEVTFWGTCAACLSEAATPSPSIPPHENRAP